MSKSLNKVTLLGNLGADPEVRSTPNGSRVATLSLATSRQWKGADGQKQENTAWHRVICWNNKTGQQLADVVERYCKKGDKLYVEGEIEYRSWEDKEGQKRYTTEIRAREIILLSGRGEAAEGGGSWSAINTGFAVSGSSIATTSSNAVQSGPSCRLSRTAGAATAPMPRCAGRTPDRRAARASLRPRSCAARRQRAPPLAETPVAPSPRARPC